MSLISVITAVVLLGVVSAGVVQYSNSLGQHRREMNTRSQEDAYRLYQHELALSGANPTGMSANPLAAATAGVTNAPNPTISLVGSAGRFLAGSADVSGYSASSDASGRSNALGYRISATGSAVSAPAPGALSPPTFRISGVVSEGEFAPSLMNLILPASSNPPGTVYRYTTDGSAPTSTSPIWLTASSSLPASPLPSTVKAAAFHTDSQYSTSTVATTNLSRSLALAFSRSLGGASTGFTYAEVTGGTNTILLSVSNAPPGTAIYYTYDGSLPTTASTLYSGGFHVPLAAWTSSVTLRAIATSASSNVSFAPLVTTLTPVQSVLPAPTFGTQGGTPTAVSIPISSSVSGVIIRYEVNGTISGSSPTVPAGSAIILGAP